MAEQSRIVQPASRRHERTQSKRIVYLAPDCTDSAVKKRAHGFIRLGHQLTSFTFRRDRYNVGGAVDWPNVEMGRSQEKRLVARVAAVLRALRTIVQHRRTWQDATLVYARNLDLAILALVGKSLTRCRAPLVFEVLDIHPLLAKRTIQGALLRWVERRVLNRCQLLVVSSPAYLREYFDRWQRFQGKTFVLENKWPHDDSFPKTRRLDCSLTTAATEKPRWTIGWFGNIRCPKSLEILRQLAEALPDQVAIYLRGCPSLLGEGVLERAIRGRDNMSFSGEYSAPEDLPAIYAKVHFNWCGDFSDGENSRWLLPNRVYEGGYLGVPALAVEGHETGRIVKERDLGITVDEPYADNLKQYLLALDHEQYSSMRRRIESQPEQHFVDHRDLAQLLNSVAPRR